MDGNLAEELVDLYVSANVFNFVEDTKHSDENFPANFSLNFDRLFQDYIQDLTQIFLKKIKSDVYNKVNIDTILGMGNSGTILSIGSEFLSELLKENNELSSKLLEENFKIKDYKWARVGKSGEITGEIKDGDKIAVIDEVGITYQTLLKWMGYIFGAYSDITFPVVIVGLDIGLKDKANNVLYKNIAEEKIDKKYNHPLESGRNVSIKPIATIEDVVTYGNFSEENTKIIENYIEKNIIYSEEVKAKKVA